MPSENPINIHFKADRAGVEFDLIDGEKTTHVFVEHDALTDASGEEREHEQDRFLQNLRIFKKHQAYFEGLATAKHLRGEVEVDGTVKITDADTARFIKDGAAVD